LIHVSHLIALHYFTHGIGRNVCFQIGEEAAAAETSVPHLPSERRFLALKESWAEGNARSLSKRRIHARSDVALRVPISNSKRRVLSAPTGSWRPWSQTAASTARMIALEPALSRPPHLINPSSIAA